MKKMSKTMGTTIESLVEQARDGNKDMLEEIIRRIQDRVYGLALRMLFHPADAEDATQEILIKIITRLDSFRGESRFDTWVYKVASKAEKAARLWGLLLRLFVRSFPEDEKSWCSAYPLD